MQSRLLRGLRADCVSYDQRSHGTAILQPRVRGCVSYDQRSHGTAILQPRVRGCVSYDIPIAMGADASG